MLIQNLKDILVYLNVLPNVKDKYVSLTEQEKIAKDIADATTYETLAAATFGGNAEGNAILPVVLTGAYTTGVDIGGTFTTGVQVSGDGTTAISVTSGFSGANMLSLAGTGSTSGILLSGACAIGLSVTGVMSDYIKIAMAGTLTAAATTNGVNVVSTNTLNGGSVNFNAMNIDMSGMTLTSANNVYGLKIVTKAGIDGAVYASDATNSAYLCDGTWAAYLIGGIYLGTSTTGINFAGTMTKGIDFSNLVSGGTGNYGVLLNSGWVSIAGGSTFGAKLMFNNTESTVMYGLGLRARTGVASGIAVGLNVAASTNIAASGGVQAIQGYCQVNAGYDVIAGSTNYCTALYGKTLMAAACLSVAQSLWIDEGSTVKATTHYLANFTLNGGAIVLDGIFHIYAGTQTASKLFILEGSCGVSAGDTKTTPTGVDKYIDISIDGTPYYVPAYASKTT